MTPLTGNDFVTFFREVWNGAEPFAWQQQLLDQIIDDYRWPDLIDIPTGLGKTATVDIALFTLAIEATTEPDRSRWRLPHRTVMVVDRRVIVDQAHDRARVLRDAILNAPEGSVSERVRDALRIRAGWETPDPSDAVPPLLTSVLRGGIVRDETWARRPEVPAVLASTVDQVGSRLLFRGYGLSTSARPIHAGLLANDTLYLLDEVHLARPFAETLDAINRLSEHAEVDAPPRRLGVVQLSATPAVEVAVRFPDTPLARPTVDPATLGEATPESVAARRTGNSKPADLVTVKVPVDSSKANEKFAKVAAAEIDDRSAGNTRLAVMVNRVDTARRTARILEGLAKKHGRYDVVLLTGRMRPFDRDEVLGFDRDEVRGQPVADRLAPGPRSPDERPLVVVATQSLEAGADFDFDVLVTECASLDALRQRFGRVDRDGQRWLNGQMSRSAVLCRSVDADGKNTDPVYGAAIATTWAWLQSQETVDFGYGAMPNPDGDQLQQLLPPVDRAPLLAASHLDRWSQTSERVISAEPDVAQWLHGIEATNEIADVQIIWRDAVDPSLVRWHDRDLDHNEADRDRLGSFVADTLEAVPPLAAEAMAVPVREVRRWLRDDDGDPLLSDAPATADADTTERPGMRSARLVARWTSDGTVLIPPEQVRPGDTIVVPAAGGGIDKANWDPVAEAPVDDVSRTLSLQVRGAAVVVLSPQQCEAAGIPWPNPDELELLRRSERSADPVNLVRERLEAFGLGGTALRAWRAVPIVTRIADDGEVHRDYLVTATLERAGTTDDLATDATDDALSLIGRPMRLDHHLKGVGYHAERFARALGWDDPLVRAVRLAGELHDAGKADSRFQRLLAGGLPSTTLLAKSASSSGDRAGQQAARRAAGYPPGMRHELLSLALVNNLGDLEDVDADLVLHIVATHHGWGRYRFRPTIDPHPEVVRVDIDTQDAGTLSLSAPTDHDLQAIGSGHSERFWTLTRRYGWWTLAHLEAILRLADHHRSHLEQQAAVEPGAFVREES